MQTMAAHQTYVVVAQITKKRSSVLEKCLKLPISNAALCHQSTPLAVASMIQIHDEVKDVGTFGGNLTHDDSASMPARPRHVVGIKFLSWLEEIKAGFDEHLMHYGTKCRSMTRRSHGVAFSSWA